MRNPANVLESLNSKACDKEYSYKRLYRNMYNPEFYLLAYQNIYSKQGNLTDGTDGLTIDGMSTKRIDTLISSLKDFSYKPNPARRTYIAKAGNTKKKRPLGIPSFNDKLIQEVVRMILESMYENTFSTHSHGFRPKRSCHTALVEIQKRFKGVKWFVEGDIKGCFDNIDHHILVSILRRRIKDENFIGLIWKFLKAGYMEDWKYYNTYSGTPQGSIISPILANIYMHELDKFMEQYARNFNKGRCRKRTKEYQKHVGNLQYLRDRKYSRKKWHTFSDEQKEIAKMEMKAVRSKMLSIDASDPMDEDFRRVMYVRYADDFLIGVIGTKQDAMDIKNAVDKFAKNKLNLELSSEKTLITNSKDKARFLSFDIFTCGNQTPRKDKRGFTRRVFSGQIMLYVPKEKWIGKLLAYDALKIEYDKNAGNKEVWKSKHRKHLLHMDDLEILRQYNSEIRGLYNYYRIANNATALGAFGFIMKYSFYKTLSAKFKSKVRRIRKKYRIGKEFGIWYDTKNGKRVTYLYNEPFVRQTDIATGNFDTLPHAYNKSKTSSLVAKLKARKCEWCGEEDVSIEIHHIRRLKDLKGKKVWERAMIGRRRKTMALCVSCHDRLHAGKLD